MDKSDEEFKKLQKRIYRRQKRKDEKVLNPEMTKEMRERVQRAKADKKQKRVIL